MRLSYSAAALVCCTLLLAGHMRGALGQPIKFPTPRISPCFTNMTKEIKQADAAAQVRQGEAALGGGGGVWRQPTGIQPLDRWLSCNRSSNPLARSPATTLPLTPTPGVSTYRATA